MKQAKQQGASLDQVADFLRNKGYEFDYATAKQEEKRTEEPIVQQEETEQGAVQSPSLLEGIRDKAVNAFTAGQGSRAAGVANTGLFRLLSKITEPFSINKDERPLTLEELDPRKWKEQYQEGKQQYEEKQKAFEKEHPVASAVADVVGTVGGLAIPAGQVGAGARAVVGATRLGKAGKVGSAIARAAGEATAFGTYEATREGFGEGRADAIEALKGFGKGAAFGGALSILGGGMQAVEESLVQTAKNLVENPINSKLLMSIAQKVVEHPVAATRVAQGAGLVAEGATIGAVPPALEGEMPTVKDIGEGLAWAAGGRAASVGISKALGGARKFVTESTQEEIERMAKQSSEREELSNSIRERDNLREAKKSYEEISKKEPLSAEQQERLNTIEERLKEANTRVDELRAQQGTESRTLKDVGATEENIKKIQSTDKEISREGAEFVAEDMAKREALAKEKEPKTFRTKLKDAVDEVRTTFNVVRPFEKIEENFQKVTGKAVDYAKRASVTLYKLANGGEWEALSRPVVNAIQEEVKKNPLVVREYDIYAQAKKRITQGVADADDFAKVRAFENNAGVKKIDEAVRKMNQVVLDDLYKAGRINKATYEQWKQNEYYVPSKVITDFADGEPIVKREMDSFAKKYKGSGELYENAAVSSLIQGKSLHGFNELNRAKQQIIDAGRKTGDVWLDSSNIDYKGGKVNYNRNKQIVVWKDGKPEVWNVPERIAQYFNPQPLEEASKAKKLLGDFMKLYKGGTTATSLGFSYSNLFRDVQGATIGSKYGGLITPSVVRDSAKELMDPKNKLADFFRREQGGKTALTTEAIKGLSKDSIEDAKNLIEGIHSSEKSGQKAIIAKGLGDALGLYSSKLKNVFKGAPKKGLEALTYAGQLGEETTRFSVFKSVLEAKAKNPTELKQWMENPYLIPKNVLAEAGNEAREVTLNFTKKMAPWVENLNRYYLPYFKPSILGAMRGWEALTNPEIAPRAWRYIINAGILQGIINGKMGSKEELERYEAINNEIAGKTFILQGKNGRLYTLPLSQEFGPLTKVVGLITEGLYRGANKKEARKDLLREMGAAAMQEAENMIPTVGYFTNPSNMVVQPLKVPVELTINKDLYTKTPIEPEYLKALPPSMRYTANTSKTLVSLARWASDHGVEVSPMVLQHIVKGTTSSTGKEALALADTALANLISMDLRPRQEMENNPLIRRFLADIYAPYSQISIDARNIVEKNKQGFTALEKGKVKEGTKKYEKYEKQAEIYESVKEYSDAINEMYKERKDILEGLMLDGQMNRAKYERGEISKEKLLEENDKLMKGAEGDLTAIKYDLREAELSIIRLEKEIKRSQKKAPK